MSGEEQQLLSCADQGTVFIEQLIEYVYTYPVLYDLNHKDYKNIRKKDRIWEEIGREIHEPGDMLKKKWKNLRDTYMKYLRSTKCSTGQAKKNYKGWQWAATMERFTPFVNFAQTESKVSRGVGEISRPSPSPSPSPAPSPSPSISYDNEENAETIQAEEIRPTTDDNTIMPKRKRPKTTSNTSNTEKVLEYLQSKTREKMDDVDYLMQGYAKTIKKLSSRGQAVAKLKIGQIVSEIELEELETRPSSHRSNSPYNSMVDYTNFSSPEDCNVSVFNTFHNI